MRNKWVPLQLCGVTELFQVVNAHNYLCVDNLFLVNLLNCAILALFVVIVVSVSVAAEAARLSDENIHMLKHLGVKKN